MEFAKTYTTQEKITADKEGIEIKKTIISNDAFAIGEAINELIKQNEAARVSLLMNNG